MRHKNFLSRSHFVENDGQNPKPYIIEDIPHRNLEFANPLNFTTGDSDSVGGHWTLDL